MTTRGRSVLLILLAVFTFGCESGHAPTATPIATPATPLGPGPSVAPPPLATVAPPVATAVPVAPNARESAHPQPTATPVVAAIEQRAVQPAPAAQPAAPAIAPVPQPAAPPFAPVATVAPVRPRAFRTPERAGGPAFVPPQGDAAAAADTPPLNQAPAPMNGDSGARSTSGMVVFRVTARTAVEGFDLRVAYPTALGSFASKSQSANCTAGTGSMVAASDRDGQLHLVVASAQALPLPLDVFCPFTVAPGARLAANAFDVFVAEVASNAKKADPSLLIVNVVVR